MLPALEASIARVTGACWIATAFCLGRKFLHSDYDTRRRR